MTTDTNPLQERIARALAESDGIGGPSAAVLYMESAAAILPIIEAEVQAAYDNGYDAGRFDGECTSYTRPEDRPYRATDYEQED